MWNKVDDDTHLAPRLMGRRSVGKRCCNLGFGNSRGKNNSEYTTRDRLFLSTIHSLQRLHKRHCLSMTRISDSSPRTTNHATESPKLPQTYCTLSQTDGESGCGTSATPASAVIMQSASPPSKCEQLFLSETAQTCSGTRTPCLRGRMQCTARLCSTTYHPGQVHASVLQSPWQGTVQALPRG